MALEKVLALDSTGVIEKEIETGGGGGAGTATKQSITLSLGQTVVVVPGGYTAAGVLVFLNGAYLSPSEYAASSSPNIVLAIGAPSTGSVLDVIVLTADGLAVLTGVHNLGVGSFAKNKIINGKMEIAQRGVNFPAASGYTLDAWVYAAVSAAIVTISKGFVGGEFQNCLQATVTTADAIISAGDVAVLQHRIEGYNITDLIGATFTLSFLVKSAKTGVHCCSLKNVAPNKSYVAEYTILEANVWEYKTITIVGGLPVDGTWNYTNGIGLRVLFAMVCGATYQTTPDAWQSGDFNATANQVNALDTIGNSFAITGVQLELGSVATPFEHRPYGQELALCQRYYFDPYAGITAANVPVGMAWQGNSTSGFNAEIKFPVPMRVHPILGDITPSNFAVGYPYSYGISSLAAIGASSGNSIVLQGALATWTGPPCGQLYRPGTTGSLPFSSEL